jgi:hypothetical protein
MHFAQKQHSLEEHCFFLCFDIFVVALKKLLFLQNNNCVHKKLMFLTRFARWFVCKPKIAIWVNFGWVLLWKIFVYFMTIWSTLRPLEIHVIAIWYILW